MNEVLIADVPPVKQSADDWIAPDCHGLNFFDIDQSLRGLLEIHMPEELRRHMTPHYRRGDRRRPTR